MASLNTPPIHGQSPSSRLPVHPLYAEAQQRVAQERQRDEGGSPGNLSGNSPMNYPRNLATYYPDSDISTWIGPVLRIILSRSTSLSFDVLDSHNDVAYPIEIKSDESLAEVLQLKPAVRIMFLGSGNPSPIEPRQVYLPALLKIFTHYNVSPHFLAGVTLQTHDQPLGSVCIGVQSKVQFSQHCPGVVEAYHLWYSLPLRRPVPVTDPEAPFIPSVLMLERTSDAIIEFQRRLYVIYDHSEKSSVTLYQSSLLDEGSSMDGFMECFQHSNQLKLKEDPFCLHLLHMTSAIDCWRMVLMHCSMEISVLETEALTADETPGLPLLPFTRALHNLAIHIIRWKTEIKLTLNIVDDLHRKHIEFYDNILIE